MTLAQPAPASYHFAGHLPELSFEVVQPSCARDRFGRFPIERPHGGEASLIELPGSSFDLHNLSLHSGDPSARELAQLCEIPRMSTAAMAAIVNRAVAAMPQPQSYVNVGVWRGFTLFAGMLGNPGKQCVGIDNFSEFDGPRDAFLEGLGRWDTSGRSFHEMDYRDYFDRVHGGRIGVYFYDGSHAYEDQLRGLEVAEPFFADGCIVLVDDTNWSEPREATLDFAAESAHRYEVLLDQRTGGPRHPTLWNGLMVLRLVDDEPLPHPTRAPGSAPGDAPIAPSEAADPLADYVGRPGPGAPRVSVVIRGAADPQLLPAAVEAALGQTWPEVEVLVAGEQGSGAAAAVRDFGDRVRVITPAAGESALREAVQASGGRFVGVTGADTPLRDSAAHMALGFPGSTDFAAGRLAPRRLDRYETALLVADDIAAVVPPGESFAVACGRLELPLTLGSRRPLPLSPKESLSGARDGGAGEDALSPVERLDQLRRSGVRHAAFAWTGLRWLDGQPELRDRLATGARQALASERTLIFELI